MRSNGVHRLLAGLIVGGGLLLGACTHGHHSSDAAGGDDESYPTNYKTDILAAMHVYLNDPTGIRDAGISAPALQPVGGVKRYVVCLRYNARTRLNAKKGSTDYAGMNETAAVFVGGRFDRFVEKTGEQTALEQCAGETYTPFPELEKLSR